MKDPAIRAVRDRLLAGAARRGLAASICVVREEGNLTRFANDEIHQNVCQEDVCFTVRGLRDGRLATTRFHGTSIDAVDRALDRLESLVSLTPAIEGLRALPEGARGLEISHVAQGTVRTTLAAKAKRIRDVHLCARERGVRTFGAFVTGRTFLAVATTDGARATLEATDATFEIVAATDTRTGYAQSSDLDASRIDALETASEAIEKAAVRTAPEALSPGEYDVVLAPYAVEPLLDQIGMDGAGGRAHVDGISFLLAKEGRRVFADGITLADDGGDPTRSFPLPFDADGVPKGPAVIVDRGVFQGALHDPLTARLAKAPPCATNRSTAGLLDFFGSPPVATNLVLAPGEGTESDLLSRIDRGIYVTRLWYVRMQDAPRGVSTGMTRDGTFLVRNGEIGPPIADLRFTQALEEIFSRAVGVGREGKLLSPTMWFQPRIRTSTHAPPVRIAGMRFTS